MRALTISRLSVAFGRTARIQLRHPQSAAGTLLVAFFLILALFGPQLAPHSNPNDQSHDVRVPPTLDLGALQLGEHPFGTDRLGRDVYSRVILGAGSIFRIAGLGTLISVILGSALGLFMGYQGGWVDELIGRVIDALLAIPALLLALVLIGIIRNLDFAAGSWQAALADNVILLVISLLYIPIVARVARSTTLDIKTREYVEAAQIRGESQFYIIFREILPSVIPSLVVEASLRFSYAIFLVASLGFLGFGARPPSPDWGLMVNENRGGFYQLTPWALEFPALAIAILVIAVNLMSDGIRRAVQKGS
ncbi:MAG: ABC transporter permease [Chloroflexi bacterium]|nr:ABC transporter permease [Chloroflexota bacterium]